jgi:hypothetical protein
MARPVAGTRKNTIVLTLPGSPKGAKENLEAVLKLLPHACIQAAGANTRLLHVGGVKKLEQDAGFTSPKETTGMFERRHARQVCSNADKPSCSIWTSQSPPSPRTWPLSWPWQPYRTKTLHKARRPTSIE